MPKKTFTIHDLPTSERPRERLQQFGAENLSAQELLAVILGRGIAGESVMVTAQRILKQFKTIKELAGASVEELSQIHGIGPAKASQLKAAFELANRVDGEIKTDNKVPIVSPVDVAKLVQPRLKGKKKEYFLALMLDTRGRVIKQCEISIGSLDTSIVHPRELFKEAIAASAASVILVHNHPSGNPDPSDDDIKLTQRVAKAGELIGIDVLDHIIIGDKDFLSLKAKGLF